MSQPEDYNPGGSLSESSEECSAHERSKHSYISFDILLTVYTSQIYMYKASNGSWVIVAPYKIKKEGYLLRRSG